MSHIGKIRGTHKYPKKTNEKSQIICFVSYLEIDFSWNNLLCKIKLYNCIEL